MITKSATIFTHFVPYKHQPKPLNYTVTFTRGGLLTAQMAEWYRALDSGLSCRLGFDSESGQTNDFEIGIHSFPT